MHTILCFFLSLLNAEKPTKKPHDFFVDLKFFLILFRAWLASATGNNGELKKKEWFETNYRILRVHCKTCIIMSTMTSQCHFTLKLIPRIMRYIINVVYTLPFDLTNLWCTLSIFACLQLKLICWRRWVPMLYNLLTFCMSIDKRYGFYCCLRSS